jgi:hypothetical protein
MDWLRGFIIGFMQNRRFSTERPASRSRNFKVVVAFDDNATSSPALKTCEYVIQQLGDDIEVRRKIVDFNQTSPQRRAAAARDAAKADMVIVATRENEELPTTMQEWMDEWATNRRADEGALVAILNPAPGPGATPRVRDQLANVARQAHMDFFSSEVSPV